MNQDYYRYGSQCPPRKIEKIRHTAHLPENRVFSLICQLEKELQEIVEGSDQFLLTVSMTRAALKRIKKFF